MLTGKCKEAFEKWYVNKYCGEDGCLINLHSFKVLPIEFKWGVYQKFFKSNGVFIGMDELNFYWVYEIVENKDFSGIESETEAIKKANELYNEKHFVFPHDLPKEPLKK